MFKLKSNVPDFDVVDGPFAGRKYEAQETYAEVPPEYQSKFEEIKLNVEAAPKIEQSSSADATEATFGGKSK